MPGWLSRCVIAFVVVVSAGCGGDKPAPPPATKFGARQQAAFTFNPDGSGKFTYEVVGTSMSCVRRATPLDLRRTAQSIINRSGDIDTWTDVACELRPDGRVWFKGTAYFRDTSKVSIPNGPMFFPAWAPDGQGGMVLEITRRRAGTRGRKPGPLSDAQVAERIKKIRTQHAKHRPFRQALQSLYDTDLVLRFPGHVVESTNFPAGKGGTFRLVFEGEKVMAARDAMVADDTALREILAAGEGVNGQGPVYLRKLFGKMYGTDGPARARVGAPMTPQFDYAAEVAAAKKSYIQTLRKAGLIPATLPQPKEGYAFDKIEVVSVRYDTMFRTTPLKYPQCVLWVKATLSRPAYKCLAGEQYTAITDTGEVLFPRVGYRHTINSGTLRKDRKSFGFFVHLGVPEPGAKRLKEVTGVMAVAAADGIKEVDLGVTKLAGKVKSPHLGAMVSTRPTTIKGKPATSVSVSIKMPSGQVMGMTVYDADGKPLRSRQGSRTGRSDRVSVSQTFEGELPKNGKVVVAILDNFCRIDVPFRLTDIKLPAPPKP